MRQQDIARLEFRKMATQEDLKNSQAGTITAKSSLWGFTWNEDDEDAARAMGDHSTKKGGEYLIWLDPADVMQYGLTDRMRSALADAPELREPVQREGISEAREGHPEASETREGTEGPPEGVESFVTYGEAAGWRWQRVQDGDQVWWAVDNRPQIDAWTMDLRLGPHPPPKLQTFVLPDSLLAALGRVGPHSIGWPEASGWAVADGVPRSR